MKKLYSIILLSLSFFICSQDLNGQNQNNKSDSIQRLSNPIKQPNIESSPVQNKLNTSPVKTDSFPEENKGTIYNTLPSRAGKPARNSESFISPNSEGNIGYASLYGLLGMSDGDFKTVSNGDWGIGFGFAGMYNFLGTKDEFKNPVGIYLGGSFDYLYFGGESKDHIEDDKTYYYLQNTVTTKVNQNAYALQLVSRITLFIGYIIPFIEGSAGGRWFNGVNIVSVENDLKPGYSKANFKPTTNSDRVSIASSIVGVYAYGGGLLIGSPNVKLELKYMIVKGSTARYIDQKTVEIDAVNNVVKYQTKSSTTDMIIPQIGLSFIF